VNLSSLLTRTRPILIAFAILFAIAGQVALNNQHIPFGILFFALAAITFLASLPNDIATTIAPTPDKAHSLPLWWRILFAIASAICTVLAFITNTDKSFDVGGVTEYSFTMLGVVSWVSSVLFFLIAFWEPERNIAEWRTQIGEWLEQWRNGFDVRLSWTTIALVAVMALGIIFYFYRLDATPTEMTSDHAEKLFDVNDILEGHTPLFFIRNTGREPFQFYWTVLVMTLTQIPLSYLALKFGTALLGVLVIPGTFLLAREMFDDTTAVFAAFFVAVMHWAVTIARMGLRYPITPFFTVWTMYFFWRALKYGKRNDFLMTGLVMGAGLYGYIPSRNVPLVILGLLVLWIFFESRLSLRGAERRSNLSNSLKDCFVAPFANAPRNDMTMGNWRPLALNVGTMYTLMLVVFGPLLRYSIDNPDMFWYRALTRVSSTERAIEGNAIAILAQNVANLALAFNWRGEEVWVTNISYQPAFDTISGALFVLGIVFAIYAMVRYRAPKYLYLLAAFGVLILPSALAIAFPRENPSFVRMGGAIPFAAIILALPLVVLARAWQRAMPNRIGTIAKTSIVGIVLVLIALLNFQWYFVDYDYSYHLSSQNSSEVAAVIRDYANSIGDLKHAYFIGYPHWLDGRAVALNIGDIQWNNFTLDVDDFLVAPTTNLLFILHPQDKDNLQKLLTRYPHGQIKLERAWTPEKDFVAFFVPKK
jgi:hypothetical protein